ncbi:uncharacterized protein LOC100678583 [Nasonia vitripennis]|uniref:Uncharacterized protein n=1 Tax=Nasonia vitripennis TaxID=7425 RepID=A0A7M7TAI8_NASVI|nr:uncharacterized protein LOC100678583 [Nasonia vitripennis]
MALENEISSSDTLERSNVTSLQSDDRSTKIQKSPELNSHNTNLNPQQNCFYQQHTLGKVKLIPCPVLNSNFEPTRQCLCQQFQLGAYYPPNQNVDGNERKEKRRFNLKWPRQSYVNKKDKSYEAKFKNRPYFRNDKPFACYGVLEGMPRKKTSRFKYVIGSSAKHRLNPHNDVDSDQPEKIEIYYFDHGNSGYYHTTDLPPILKTEKFAEETSSKITQFWAEIFGYVHIIVSVITALVLQFLRCILFSLIRPLTVGVIQLMADYFIKPLLSITFNGLIQPFLILFYNVATSLRDCCEPLATALGYYMRELAVLFRSCRLIEINHGDRGIANT